MINKTLLLAVGILLFTGCNKKHPEPSVGLNNVSDVAQIAGETVTIDENAYSDNGQNSMNGAKIQKSSETSKFNSSSDGFRSLYFGFGEYGISADMQTNIESDVSVARQSNSKIKIEGNCDEFGTDEYNYALGLKRAKAVKESLIGQGVSASRMVMISYGESSPVCNEPTDECYARNRRVDLRLVR